MGDGTQRYDVAIVGASMAGSVSALLYARYGLRVALIERHSDPAAFKRVCTHLIQPSATPMLKRTGLDKVIEDQGGIRYALNIWSRWGWIRPPQYQSPQTAEEYGYNIRREVIDPVFRSMAGESESVDLMLGYSAEEIVRDGDRVTGLVLRAPDDSRVTVEAGLVVGADGRNSAVAQMAGVKAWTLPNNRVAYGAYYRNLPEPVGDIARVWFLEPDIAYTFPTDDGQAILATMFPKSKLPAVKKQLHSDLPGLFEGVPDFPSFAGAEPVTGLIGMASMPNQWRRRPPAGLAFVGDAAVSADPLFGVGCGWALQSAEWLVESTAQAVGSPARLEDAVDAYRSRLRKSVWGHFLITSDYSRARRFNPAEKLLFSAAARDDGKVATKFGYLGTRTAPSRGFLSPIFSAQAAVVNLKHMARGEGKPKPPRGLGSAPKQDLVVNGLRTPVLEAGDTQSDDAVVFVHGNPGSSDDWFDLVGRAGEFSRAVSFDLPGFGDADKPRDFDYTVQGYASHLDASLKQLGIRRAHLVVHDFGGPFGLMWAAQNPENVGSLTLINTGALQGYRWHYLAKIWRTPILGELFQASASRPAFRLLLKHGNPRGLPRHFVDRMYDQYDSGTKRAILKLYRATKPDRLESFVEPLKALNPPTLVLWGAKDPYISVKQAHLQTNVFPKAQVEILPDSGHWPFMDNPERSEEIVLHFLREQTGARDPESVPSTA